MKVEMNYENWKEPEVVEASKPLMNDIIRALADYSGIDEDEIIWNEDGFLAVFYDECGAKFTVKEIKGE